MSTPLISCQTLSKSFSADPLFENLSLSINEGERIGIVGPNGCGKSTLLKMIAKLETTDEGEIVRRRNLKVNYCPQEHEFEKDSSIWQLALQKSKELQMDPMIAEGEIGIWLGRAGFEDFDVQAGSLSGGWRKRLGIAQSLLADPDLVLLDEPTNHLDFEGIAWLTEILSQANFSFVTISHDRHFLESTCNRIIEVNPSYPDGYLSHEGGYKDFVVFRQKYFEDAASYEKSLATKVKRESAWLKQGVKARTTKSQYRIDQAHQWISELAKLRTTRLSQEKKVGVDFQASGRKSKKLVELKDVHKTLSGKKVLNALEFELLKHQKIGLIGPNGSGKSTILKLLAGEIAEDSGSVIRATNCKIVYFDQKREGLDENWTLKRALSDEGDSVIFQDRSIHVVTWAQRFRFTVEQLKTPVKDLSGGEKARLLIARLMLKPADVLLLDEPTNDLDLDTLELLEENLINFSGCLMLVTHDRFMLEKVCDRFLALDGRGNWEIVHGLNQWQRWVQLSQNSEAEKLQAQPTKESQQKASSKKKLSYMEQREFDSLEEKIFSAEETLSLLEAKVEDPKLASDSKGLTEACEKLELAKKEVENLYSRWSELEAKQN